MGSSLLHTNQTICVPMYLQNVDKEFEDLSILALVYSKMEQCHLIPLTVELHKSKHFVFKICSSAKTSSHIT